MVLKATLVPIDESITDKKGKLKLGFRTFFKNLEKNPGDIFADVVCTGDYAVDGPVFEAAINEIFTILRNNKLQDVDKE